MDKVATIIAKEWAEVFRNRMVLFSVIFMPLLFAVLPLGFLFFLRGASTDSVSQLPVSSMGDCGGLSDAECFHAYLLAQLMFFFLLSPLIIPVNIASYSVVGEKTTRSLEPLLATPITTVELLAGKNLAAAIPAVTATWLSVLVFGTGVRMLTSSRVLAALFAPVWVFAIVAVAPLLSLLSVNFSLMVSSRVNDPRVAEQLSAVVILPILLLFVGQIAGVAILDLRAMVLLAIALLAVDGLLLVAAVRLFQRETILTRWK